MITIVDDMLLKGVSHEAKEGTYDPNNKDEVLDL